jgi:hypothetical protein
MLSIASRSTKKIKGRLQRLFRARDHQEEGESSPSPDGRASISSLLGGLMARVTAISRRLFFMRRPHAVTGRVLSARPGRLVLSTVCLVCLCAILVYWGRRPRSDSADFDLHADNSCSNLDNTSAEQPAAVSEAPTQPTVEAVQSEKSAEESEPLAVSPPPAVVQVSQSDATESGHSLPPPPEQATKLAPNLPSQTLAPPPVPAPEPLRLTEPAPDNAVPTPAAMDKPEMSDPLEDWHRGDVPMTRNWHKMLGYQAILAAAMFAVPATAQDPPKVKLEDIKELLTKIEHKMSSLDTLKSDVGGLKTEMKLMREANNGAFSDFNRRMEELEAKFKALETRLNQAQTRIANFPPNQTAPATGRLRLLNNFPSPARVILNNTVYRLNPLESRNVDLPVGPYTFEVLIDGFGSIQPPTTGVLAANTPRTIEIFAR